jgi:hypothetical protein
MLMTCSHIFVLAIRRVVHLPLGPPPPPPSLPPAKPARVSPPCLPAPSTTTTQHGLHSQGCPRLSEAFLHHLSPAQPLLVLRAPGLQVGELGLSALLAGPGPGLTKLEVDSVTTNTPGECGWVGG